MVPAPPLVYLDNSVLGRLTDTTSALEAEVAAAVRIVNACASGRRWLAISAVLEAEVENAPPHVYPTSALVLTYAPTCVSLAEVFRGTRRLGSLGMDPDDTLHLAAAVVGGARFALSCDADWLRRATRFAALLGPAPTIVSPVELVRQEGL